MCLLFSILLDTMSSITVTLTGNTSSLTAHFHPEIELDEKENYSCCLLDFNTYNTIPNIHSKNNQFQYYVREKYQISKQKNDAGDIIDVNMVELPIGSYELTDIAEYLSNTLRRLGKNIKLTANKNTMKCIIETSAEMIIDFTKHNSIGKVLGFNSKLLAGQTTYVSDHSVNIQDTTVVRVNCDLVTGSFHNGQITHTLYEFYPEADPGRKIIEQPRNLIYLPIVRRRINSINISLLDQEGKLVDFRGEQICCRIHIKRGI